MPSFSRHGSRRPEWQKERRAIRRSLAYEEMMAPRPKILLVDDDPSVRASLAFSLELEGFLIETFDAADALLARTEFPAEACLVIDYRLPGIDGFALLETLRSRGIRLPAIIITSTPTRLVRNLAAAAGTPIVEKPLMCDALTLAIRSGLVARAA
jgi:two-component system response regulator FixJ